MEAMLYSPKSQDPLMLVESRSLRLLVLLFPKERIRRIKFNVGNWLLLFIAKLISPKNS